jgi:hypothetical protein
LCRVKSIEILCGYESDNYTLFKGVVIKHSIKLRNSGSQLVIECRDKAIAMTLARHSKYFGEKVKDSDAITTVAGTYGGLTADVADHECYHQRPGAIRGHRLGFYNRAGPRLNGMLVYTDDNTLSIKKPLN